MQTKCNSCGGTYDNTQPDGSRYFHACSPEIVTVRAIDDGTGEITTAEVRTPRAVIRNENLQRHVIGQDEQITSEGDGVTPQ